VPSINLIPFNFGDCSILDLCVRSIIENIILTIPFSFGINFLVKIKTKYIFRLAFVVGFGFEFSQLVISLAFRSAFRTIDINDVILNGMGVLIGYALFRAFAWVTIKIVEYYKIKEPYWTQRN